MADLSADQLAEKVRAAIYPRTDGLNALDALLACLAEAQTRATFWRDEADALLARLAEAEKDKLFWKDAADRTTADIAAERDRLKADVLLAGSHLDWLIGYLDIDAADDWMVAAIEKAKAARAVLSDDA